MTSVGPAFWVVQNAFIHGDNELDTTLKTMPRLIYILLVTFLPISG